MNVLVIAPHPDDEAIGCGGTICKHTACGDRVLAVFLTSGELGLKQLPRKKAWSIREQEARCAAKILRLADTVFLRGSDWTVGNEARAVAVRLKPVLERERPELIYLPHPLEWHPDHAAAIRILRLDLRVAGASISGEANRLCWRGPRIECVPRRVVIQKPLCGSVPNPPTGRALR